MKAVAVPGAEADEEPESLVALAHTIDTSIQRAREHLVRSGQARPQVQPYVYYFHTPTPLAYTVGEAVYRQTTAPSYREPAGLVQAIDVEQGLVFVGDYSCLPRCVRLSMLLSVSR